MKTVKLTNDDLMKYALELTAFSQQIKILRRLTENVEYARIPGDRSAVSHQIQSGLLDEIGDNLQLIEDGIQRISNEICPD